MQHPQALVEFDHGRVVATGAKHERGPQSFDPQRLDDPVLKTQRQIVETLEPYFCVIRTVSFSNRGE